MSTALDHARSQLQALLDDALHRRACADAEVRALGAALVALDRAGHDARPLPGGAWTLHATRTRDELAANIDKLTADETAEQIRMAAKKPSVVTAMLREARASVALDGDTIDVGPPAEKRPRSGQRRYDYAEVAEVCRAALADGTPLVAAMSARFGLQKDAARKLIQSARRAGEDIPPAPPGARRRKPAADPVPDVIATQAARRAETVDPLPMSLAAELEAEDDVPAGPPAYGKHVRFVDVPEFAVIPHGPPAAIYEDTEWTPAPGQACHICDDCGYATERKGLLSIHVHSHHHRSLTATESRFQIYEPDEVTA